jgi:hypothetical protein
MQIYLAKYTDKHGEIETTICNDYKTLRMNIRGIGFSGSSFDNLHPGNETNISKLETFAFVQGILCDCKISYEMPIEIIAEENLIIGKLNVHIELGKPTVLGGTNRGDIAIILSYDESSFRSNGTSEWFEDELLDIQNQLPENHKLKCCFGCAFSDYSVYGHSFYADMMCYINAKEDYKKVSDKRTYMEIMGINTENVQETYLCPKFEVRKAGAGYRG